MTRYFLTALLLCGQALAADPVEYVNPMIGTLASRLPHTAHGGNTVPAATMPHGMVQWGPITTPSVRHPKGPGGYYYDAAAIVGFPLTQISGAGCSSNGEFPVMPMSAPGQLQSSFSHARETAQPGYYRVRLDSGIEAEFSATLRSGMARFSFAPGQPALLRIDASRTNSASRPAEAVLTPLSPTAISGTTVGGNFCESKWSAKVHFYAQFDRPYRVQQLADGATVLAFEPGATVQMKAGLSYVSQVNAQDNLAQENPGWDFDAVRRAARAAWNARLRTIEVDGGTLEERTKFYTAFYHTQWSPNVFSDANGQYLGMDGVVHQVAPGQAAQYTSYSSWDIYRALVPLQALLAPREMSDMAQSLVNYAQQCGSFPNWVNDNVETGVMPGAPGALVVMQAHAFGARTFDTGAALETLRRLQNRPGTACGRVVTTPGKTSYLRYGYIAQGEWDESRAPKDRDWVFCLNRSRYKNRCNADGEIGPASTTLEYTAADFAAARFAEALGDRRNARIWLGRSANWRNLIQPRATPGLAARDAQGQWLADAGDRRHYVEGNGEQYTWMVPYDAAGLVQALGGAGPVRDRLDRFFSELNAGPALPYFYMGNETTFEVPWLYNWVGAPSHAQRTLRHIMDTTFSAAPDGLPGSDDLGGLSSWYVWSALGLYPQVPGVAGLAVASPQFPRIRVHLGNGKLWDIRAAGARDLPYVHALRVGGQVHPKAWLDLEALMQGAELDFTLGPAPSAWASAASDAPPSFGVAAATLADAANSQGIGAGADFDGQGHGYAPAALARAGAQAGKPLRVAGAAFAWPAAGTGLDNTIAVGQTIAVQGQGQALVLLAAATDGPSKGTLTIHYAGGSSATAELTVDDWTLDGGRSKPRAQAVLAMDERQGPDGQPEAAKVYVFANRIPLDPKRTVTAVTLPGQVSRGRIHLFGLAIAPAARRGVAQ
jgi:predicted alpha-1,2-mannosidase